MTLKIMIIIEFDPAKPKLNDKPKDINNNSNNMEEHTLKLAQSLAKQSLDEDEASEARDGSPKPLKKTHASKLEEKVKGFRSVSV